MSEKLHNETDNINGESLFVEVSGVTENVEIIIRSKRETKPECYKLIDKFWKDMFENDATGLAHLYSALLGLGTDHIPDMHNIFKRKMYEVGIEMNIYIDSVKNEK